MLRDKVSAETLAALLPSTITPPPVDAKELTPALLMRTLSEAGITCSVVSGRLILAGGHPQVREGLIRTVHSRPDLEARTILMAALADSVLREAIEERASIRWADGYTDSLYAAVLCNITDTAETSGRGPDGEVILQAVTDWDAEWERYKHTGGITK